MHAYIAQRLVQLCKKPSKTSMAMIVMCVGANKKHVLSFYLPHNTHTKAGGMSVFPLLTNMLFQKAFFRVGFCARTSAIALAASTPNVFPPKLSDVMPSHSSIASTMSATVFVCVCVCVCVCVHVLCVYVYVCG